MGGWQAAVCVAGGRVEVQLSSTQAGSQSSRRDRQQALLLYAAEFWNKGLFLLITNTTVIFCIARL